MNPHHGFYGLQPPQAISSGGVDATSSWKLLATLMQSYSREQILRAFPAIGIQQVPIARRFERLGDQRKFFGGEIHRMLLQHVRFGQTECDPWEPVERVSLDVCHQVSSVFVAGGELQNVFGMTAFDRPATDVAWNLFIDAGAP